MKTSTFCWAVVTVMLVGGLIIISNKLDNLERQFDDLLRIVEKQTELIVANEQADRWKESVDSEKINVGRNAWRDSRPTDSLETMLEKEEVPPRDSVWTYDLGTALGRQKYYELTGKRWKE